jgi:phosphoglycolate phosphatase
MNKIVIFDMDGTLIDSKRDITISVNYVRDFIYNLEPLSEEFIVDAINMEVRNLPKLFYDTDIYEQKARDVFEEHYFEQCIKNPYLYDGVEKTLKELISNDVKLSVATNAPTVFAQRMLSSLDVAGLFDVIIGADKVKSPKPDPQIIFEILNFYDFDKDRENIWMIGDNTKDIMSAKNANINSIFATWGFTSEAKHDYVVKHPKEILDIVL